MDHLFSKIDLSQVDLNLPETGSKDSKYAKIVNSRVLYKGKAYDIKHIGAEVIEVDSSGDLFGQWGDEIPLELIKF